MWNILICKSMLHDETFLGTPASILESPGAQATNVIVLSGSGISANLADKACKVGIHVALQKEGTV